MKVLKYIQIMCFAFVLFSCTNEEKNEAIRTTTIVKDGITTSVFKVWGNCEMCKETIEKSLAIDGIIKSDWNTDSKLMTVSYDEKKINLDQIQQKIASVGYDTDKFKGDDTAYNSLHECCQYERK